jgi:hypothetical protein
LVRALIGVGLLGLLGAGGGHGLRQLQAAEGAPPGVGAKAAFDALKALNGDWAGTVGTRAGGPGKVSFRVTSAGSAVFERQFPDQPHEMTSVYHLDGEDLVLTHYCAAGNQPRMRLNRGKSSAKELVFEFAGGTNLDPGKDGHVHAGRIRILEGNRFEAEWYFHADGKPAGTNGFFMSRSPKP